MWEVKKHPKAFGVAGTAHQGDVGGWELLGMVMLILCWDRHWATCHSSGALILFFSSICYMSVISTWASYAENTAISPKDQEWGQRYFWFGFQPQLSKLGKMETSTVWQPGFPLGCRTGNVHRRGERHNYIPILWIPGFNFKTALLCMDNRIRPPFQKNGWEKEIYQFS